jgi:hypothetical protein
MQWYTISQIFYDMQMRETHTDTHYTQNYGATEVELRINSVALVRKRTIPTEQPLLVSKVSANFCG